MRRYLIIALAALVLIPSAVAGDPGQIANLGYSVSSLDLGNGCTRYSATGYGASVTFGTTCDAGFSAAIDTFIAEHPERKLNFEQPAAAGARSTVTGKGYAITTDYAGPSFRVTGGCNVDQTVDTAGLVALAASLAQAAPCPPPPSPEPPPPPPPTEPPPPTIDPVVEARLAALEAAAAQLRADLDLLRAEFDAHVAAIPGASIEEATRIANAIMDAS